METSRDLSVISVATACGAAVGALVIWTHQHPVYQYLFASSAFFASVTILALMHTQYQHRSSISTNGYLWFAAFVLTGFCGYMVRTLTSPFSTTENLLASWASNAGELIDSIPFRERFSNAFLKAIILGDRSDMDSATRDAFRNAGAAHLLALSGMHLGTIYLLMEKSLKLFGNTIPLRKIRSGVIIAITLAYTLMCGAGPSLLRAWLFIALREGGKILDRPQDPRDILLSALTIHLIFRPDCITELGFQLSYGAMVGIVYLWPLIKNIYPEEEPGRKIWELTSLSISAQAFTAPLTLLHFGTFPKFFMITNLVAAPLMGVVMICGITAIAMAELTTATVIFQILEYPILLLRDLITLISCVEP